MKIRIDDPGEPEGCTVCQLRRLYDPAGFQTQWDECRSGARGCGRSKTETTEIVVEAMRPLRERRERYAADPAELDRILKTGAEKAREAAEATLVEVRRIMKIR